MSGELRNFFPDKVTVTWTLASGTLDLTPGLVDGPGAIAEVKDSKPWSRRGDRNSNMVRNRSQKKGGNLNLTYVNEAKLHETLSAYAITDGQTGAIVGTIKIRDLNGSTVITYLGAFIEDDPTNTYGDTAGDRVWSFGYAERIVFHGGAETA